MTDVRDPSHGTGRGPVLLACWRAEWPEDAAREAESLRRVAAGRLVAVEHIGSTAVPGLVAKPIVDLLGGVARLADADACIRAFAGLGYAYAPEHEREIPERRYFRRSTGVVRTHHLHVVVHGGDFWRRHVRFRDALRADPQLADAYATLKRDLAARCGDDHAAYTSGKASFVERVLAGA